jgi:hypothetical protein
VFVLPIDDDDFVSRGAGPWNRCRETIDVDMYKRWAKRKGLQEEVRAKDLGYE